MTTATRYAPCVACHRTGRTRILGARIRCVVCGGLKYVEIITEAEATLLSVWVSPAQVAILPKPKSKTTDTGERKMELYGLHGDLRIERLGDVGTSNAPLTPARDYVIAGSHDGEHKICGNVEIGEKSPDGYQIVRVPADTTLTHATRHPTMPLVAGDYLIGPQRERGAGVDRAIAD